MKIKINDWLDEEIEVCENCLRASCWHGLFMCDDNKLSGTIKKPRRELLYLNLEHADYMTINGEAVSVFIGLEGEHTCPDCGADYPHLCADESWLCDECGHRWKKN